MGHVYCIRCPISHKLYIGKTVSKKLRSYIKSNYRQALNGSNSKPKLYRAIRKYGYRNFDFISLFESDDENLLFGWEKFYIKEWETDKYGYNIARGGQGSGYKHGPDCKHCLWAKTEGVKLLRENRHKRSYPSKKVVEKKGWTEEGRQAARERMLVAKSVNPAFRDAGKLGGAKRWEGHIKVPRPPNKTPEEIRLIGKQSAIKRGFSSSQYIGLRWENDRKKWHSSIWANGKRHFLGRFVSEIEAAKAYDDAAFRLLGIGPINIKEPTYAV